MDDELNCQICGGAEFRTIVQNGSYIVMCARCRTGPATSFLSVAPHLIGSYRAMILDNEFNETEVVAEGSGSSFISAVRSATNAGKRVEIISTAA